MKQRFTESQIITILNEGRSGVPIAEVLRKYQISKPTYYKWRAKYGGMNVSELKRYRELEKENSKLKQLLAETLLDNKILKDVLSKKW